MSYYNRGTEKDDDPEPMFAWVGEYLDDEEKSPPRRNEKYSPDYTGSAYPKPIDKSKYYISDSKYTGKFEKEQLPVAEKSSRSADYSRYSPERGDVTDKKYYAEKEKYLLEKSKLLDAKGRYLDMVESEKKYGSNGNSLSSDYRYPSSTSLSSKTDGHIRIDYAHGQKRSHEDDRMFQKNNNRSLVDAKYSAERTESLYPKRSDFVPLSAVDMVRKTKTQSYLPDDNRSRQLRSSRESTPPKQPSFQSKPDFDRYKPEADLYKHDSVTSSYNSESDRYKAERELDSYKLESTRYKPESDRYKVATNSYKIKSTSFESDRYKVTPDNYRSDDLVSQYKKDIGRYKAQPNKDDYGRLSTQDVRKRSLSPMDNRFSKESQRYNQMDERDHRELKEQFNELAKNERTFNDDGYSSRYGQSPDDDRPSYSTYTSSATDDVLRDRYASLRKETRETKYKGDEKYSPFDDIEMEMESSKEKFAENEKSRSARMNFNDDRVRGDEQFEREGSRSSRSMFDDRRFKDTFKEPSLPREKLSRHDDYEPPAKIRDNLRRSRSPYDQQGRSSPAIPYPMSFNDKRVVMSKNNEPTSNISKPSSFDRSTFDPEEWENKVSTESPKNRVVIRRDKLEESIDNLDSSHYQKLLRRNIVDDAIKKSVDWLTDYEIWYEKLIRPLLSASNIHCKDPFEFLMCLSRGEKWTYAYIPTFNQGGKDLLRFIELYKINIMQQPVDDNDFIEIKSKIFGVKTTPQVFPKFNQQNAQQTIRSGSENYVNFEIHRNFQNKNSIANSTTNLQVPQQRTIRKFSDKKEDSLKVNVVNKKSKVKPVSFGWNLKKDKPGAIYKPENADNEEAEHTQDASPETSLEPPTVIKKRAPSMMKPPSPLFPKKTSKSPEKLRQSRSRSPRRSTKSPRRSTRSPRRRSRSPKRRSISPRRRSISPRRRSRSPRRRSISPRRRPISPRRRSRSPRRRSITPRKRPISPRRRSRSPRRRLSPKRRSISPRRRSRSPPKKFVSPNTRIGNSRRRSISPCRRSRRSISPPRRTISNRKSISPSRRSISPRGRQGLKRSPRRRSRSPLGKQPTPPGTSRNSSPLSPIRQPAPPGIRRYSRTRPPTPPSLRNKSPTRREHDSGADVVSSGKNKSPPRRVIAKTPEKEESKNAGENSNDNIKCVISNTKLEKEPADGIWTTEEMEAEAKAEGNKMETKDQNLPLKEDDNEEKLPKKEESFEKDNHQNKSLGKDQSIQRTIIQDSIEDNIPQRYKRFGLKPPLGPRIYASVRAPVYGRKQEVTLPLLQYHVEKAVKDSLNVLYVFGKYTKNKVDNVAKTAIKNFERLHGSSTWYSIDHVCYEISQVLENKNKETLEQHSEIIKKEHGDISKVHENSRFSFLKYRTLVFHLCKKQLRPSKSYHHSTSALDAIENLADLTYPVFCGIAPVIIKLWNWREIMSSGYNQYVKSHPDASFNTAGYSKEKIPLYMNNIFRMPPFDVAETVSYRNVRQLMMIMGNETTLDDALKRIIKWWCCGYYQLKQLNDQGKMAKIEMLKETEASEKLVVLDEVYSEDEEDQQRKKELETAPTIDLF